MDVGDQAPQRVALLDLGDRIVIGGYERVDGLEHRWVWAAQFIDAAVVSDPVQPCSQGQFAAVDAQPGVCADEHLLHRVLRILRRAGEHLPRVSQHA